MNADDTRLRISLVQQNIVWEDKKANLTYIHSVVSNLEGKTDLVVFPEMCTTGFSMNSQALAETVRGETISLLKEWAIAYDLAICGSLIIEEDNKYYNRAFCITPQEEYYYDKRHLFRMGREPEAFSSGKKRMVFELKGFNICLLVCYDLRFPVWARNYHNEYDLLIYVANWPQSRAKVWNTLLEARALENMSYVCGVNRIGEDSNGLKHHGGSKVINARGDEILSIPLNQTQVETVSISITELKEFRNKFPVWKDADEFDIKL